MSMLSAIHFKFYRRDSKRDIVIAWNAFSKIKGLSKPLPYIFRNLSKNIDKANALAV